MQSEKAVGAHDIPLSRGSARLKWTHARSTQGEDVRLLHLTHVRAPKLPLWTEIYVPTASEPQWSVKRDSITARHGNETAFPLAFHPFFLFMPSFLPSFLSRYIYVAISSSSIGLPWMSELSKEKQTVYLRCTSLMHNSGVRSSTRLSQKERKSSAIRILTYSTYSTRDDVLSGCPIHLLLLPTAKLTKWQILQKLQKLPRNRSI